MIETIKAHLHKNLDYYLISLMAVLGFYLDLSLKKILFLVVAVWLVLNPIGSRAAALISVLTAVAVSLLLLLGQFDLAEQLAIGLFLILFYLLVSLIIQTFQKFSR